MQSQVDEIKEKTDIVAIIGERVALKKAGSNFRGLCPFHNEKSPSFMVSPELQIYKCFGCQAAGDVITFLQEYEGMEFYEVLKTLATKAGVKLNVYEGNQKGLKDRLFEVNSIVANFYHYILLKHTSGKGALDYLLNERKLSLSTIEKFKLGFSPDVPLALKNYVIERKKISTKELSEAGVVYNSGSRSFDRFRGRVIFPLLDHRGNTVGFAGRIMPDNSNKELAKYINSPETPVYKKSQVLFGLSETRGEIKKLSQVVVVEGELDMISSYQAGIKNVVAIKGSAISEDQSRLLSRFAKTVVLALDADFAGGEAAKRGIFVAESVGLQVKVAKIEGFKDPDEAASTDPKKLKSFIDNAVGVWDFIIDFVFSKHKSLDGIQKEKIGNELLPLLAQIDNKIAQSHYVAMVARRLNVPMESVMDEMKKINLAKNNRNEEAIIGANSQTKTRRELIEERFLSLAFQTDLKILKTSNIGDVLETPFAKKICAMLEKWPDNVKISEFAKEIPAELKDHFSDLLLSNIEGAEGLNDDRIAKELESLKREIQILNVKEDLENTGKKIQEYEALGVKTKLKKAEIKFSKLSKKLFLLKESV